MIAVIADDFTGAAEIGGIGLRYGLRVVIETEDVQQHDADLLIIATDTRSLPAKEAEAHIIKITKALQKLKPKFIFKKIDSVLRGNIVVELTAQMKASGKDRAIIVAANPVFKRIIKDGTYYIDGVPLHETFFSTDPEFPVSSSSVLEIIGNGNGATVKSLKPDGLLPEKGLIIGDVTSDSDLEKWALCNDEETLLAGASGFFEALLLGLQLTSVPETLQQIPFGRKILYILGSTYPKGSDFLVKLEDNGYAQFNMPEEIYYNKNLDLSHFDGWVKNIVCGIEEHNKVIVSILHAPCNDPDITSRIKESIGLLTLEIVKRTGLEELMIEGGATTSAILKHLNIKKLFPMQEMDTGVIRMKIDGRPGLFLTTKPGSYQWPENVWSPENIKYAPND
jgi:uncharacterized protein YgbK (DUF1537 family)